MVPPADLDRLSPAELKSLVTRQFEKIAELERTVAKRRDEIARLKGGPGRPNIKPKRHGEGDQAGEAGRSAASQAGSTKAEADDQ
jgi:hypothetical protein